jgi:hypothetical protein
MPRYWCRDQKLQHFHSSTLSELTPDGVRAVQRGGKHGQALSRSYSELGFFSEVEQTDNIKFFVTVRAPLSAERSSEERIQRFIQDALDNTVTASHILNPSLYMGYGFAWALVKAEVCKDNFSGIAELVLPLSDSLVGFGAFTNTYICCTTRNLESDDIGEEALRKATGKDIVVAATVPELYDYARQVSVADDVQHDIEAWVRKYVENIGSSASNRAVVRACLAAVVMKDEAAFFNALQGWFRDLERSLRAVWCRFVASRVGENGVQDILQAVGIQRGKDPKYFTLGDVLNICAKAIERSSHNQDENELTREWQDIANLRNDVTHGSVFPMDGGKWKDMITVLVSYFAKTRRLREVIEAEVSRRGGGQG